MPIILSKNSFSESSTEKKFFSGNPEKNFWRHLKKDGTPPWENYRLLEGILFVFICYCIIPKLLVYNVSSLLSEDTSLMLTEAWSSRKNIFLPNWNKAYFSALLHYFCIRLCVKRQCTSSSSSHTNEPFLIECREWPQAR